MPVSINASSPTFNGTVPFVRSMPKTIEDGAQSFYIGLFLAILSTFLCGISYIIKKMGLLRLAIKDSHLRAGEGGYGYLKEWMWWAGMILLVVGETTNFVAYAFAPATLVTPLGALSVLVSTIASSCILKERLNILGKIGCAICLFGSTNIVIHAPVTQEISTMEELEEKLTEPGFLVYVVLLMTLLIVMIRWIVPRYANNNILVFIIICSILGVFNVMACKGLGVALKETLSGHRNNLKNWVTWLLLVILSTSIILQMNFLNRALDIYNLSILSPILYVFFTTVVIITSLILFKEWEHLTPKDIVGQISGFLTICTAIFLLNSFKDLDISWGNVAKLYKPIRQTSNRSLYKTEDAGPLLEDLLDGCDSLSFQTEDSLEDMEMKKILPTECLSES